MPGGDFQACAHQTLRFFLLEPADLPFGQLAAGIPDARETLLAALVFATSWFCVSQEEANPACLRFFRRVSMRVAQRCRRLSGQRLGTAAPPMPNLPCRCRRPSPAGEHGRRVAVRPDGISELRVFGPPEDPQKFRDCTHYTLDGQKVKLYEFYERCRLLFPFCCMFKKFYYWESEVREITSKSTQGMVDHKIRCYHNCFSTCCPEKRDKRAKYGDVAEFYDQKGEFMGIVVYIGEGSYCYPLAATRKSFCGSL